jgi:hypothetical protein
MHRDAQDAIDASADPARWKNGRRFQSHPDDAAFQDAQAALRALAALPPDATPEQRQRAHDEALQASARHRRVIQHMMNNAT